MFGAPTLISIVVALAVALALGPLLARMTVYWFTGRGLTHLLIQARAMLLPALCAPLLTQVTNISLTLAIGLSVGISQAITVARWGTRPAGGWDPTLLGSLALGQSGAAWLARHAMARGALVSCLATTVIEVIIVEGLLCAMKIPGVHPHGSLGERLVLGPTSALPFVILAVTFLIFMIELFASLILQRRADKSS